MFAYANALNAADFGIPTPTSKTFTYASAGAADDDKVTIIVYKNEVGTTIGTLTIAYVGATNNIASITRT